MRYQQLMNHFLGTLKLQDDNVGRILDYQEKSSLAKKTIVGFTGNQGFYLGEHGWFDKRFMYEQSFRTPLIVRWPDVIKPGSVNNDMVMNLDLAETLLDAAHVKIPKDMQGRSMLPVWKGKTPGDWRKYVYYHYYESGGEHNLAKHIGVRSDQYKLIYYYENGDWELYDLQKDPNELNNIYNNADYQKIQDSLKNELQVQMKKFKDQI